MDMMNNEVQSIQFRDDYMIIETLGRTYSINYNTITNGELESLQSQILQITERTTKKKKYFDSDHWDRGIR